MLKILATKRLSTHTLLVQTELARTLLFQTRWSSTLKKSMNSFYMAVHPDFFNECPEKKVKISLLLVKIDE